MQERVAAAREASRRHGICLEAAQYRLAEGEGSHARRGSKQRWWHARIEEGRGAHYMGYLPAFVLVRSGYRMVVERPPVLGGLALLAGWASASVSGARPVDDPAAVAALRREQRERLKRLHAGAPVEPHRADAVVPAVKSR